MLQIDHIYEFFYNEIFKDFQVRSIESGVPKINPTYLDTNIFTQNDPPSKIIFFYDQEPILSSMVQPYIDLFKNASVPKILVTSEKSTDNDNIVKKNKFYSLYYFFHGFAALDWYRGYYALNYNKPIIKKEKDFITFNRLVTEDRSYRIYFVSQLAKHNLLDKGLISFGVSDNGQHWRDELERNQKTKLSSYSQQEIWNTLPDLPDRLIIDQEECSGDSSTRIPHTIDRLDFNNDTPNYDAFWHIVTETVFYYDKLHLTEKIFKPIVSKQPFMLLAAPGNLAYLKSYGFKTFDRWIDEGYDNIKDHDQRIQLVVDQIKWWCNLSDQKKYSKMCAMESTIEYNFHHFYGEFKNVIVNELITNCENLFTEIDYQHNIDFDLIKKILLN